MPPRTSPSVRWEVQDHFKIITTIIIHILDHSGFFDPSKIMYVPLCDIRPAHFHASPVTLWDGRQQTQPGWRRYFPAGSRSRQETAYSVPVQRCDVSPVAPEQNLQAHQSGSALKQERFQYATDSVSYFVLLLPPIKETQICMPQVNESVKRCNTLIKSVGSPSVAMI